MDSDNLLTQVDVIVMAAGTGNRMGIADRKQWLTLCGSPLFIYTLRQIKSYGATSMSVVIHPEDLMRTHEALKTAGLQDVTVVIGGDTRQASVHRGLLHATRDLVAIHDGARPFLQKEDLLRVLRAGFKSGAATLGAPVRDTLKTIDAAGRIQANVSRDALWAVFTPQVFRRELLLKAHEKALADGFQGTDDSVLLERIGYLVEVVAGSARNVKITEAEDLQLIKWWEAENCASD